MNFYFLSWNTENRKNWIWKCFIFEENKSMRRTVADLANEIGVYIKTINFYQEIFSVNFQIPKYVYHPQLYYLGGYQEVKNEFCNYVLANKEFFIELQNDYYLSKTPKFISHKIECDVDDVLEIIN